MAKFYSRLFLLFLLMSFNAYAQNNGKAYIGFYRVLSDTELLNFMSKSNASPRAARMWSYGFSGSYRTSHDISAEEFVADIREYSIDFFRGSLESNVRFIEKFLEDNSEEIILTDDNVQTSARSLVSSNRQLKRALKFAENGGPLVYELLLEGSDQDLNVLKNDQLGESHVNFQFSREVGFGQPKRFQNGTIDADANSALPSEIYQQLRIIAQNLVY